MKAITNNIYYVGVNDRNKHLFDFVPCGLFSL